MEDQNYTSERVFKEGQFNQGEAIAYLLANGEAYILPSEAQWTLNLNVNDVFAWGHSDSEQIGHDELEELTKRVIENPLWGVTLHVVIKRCQLPQDPIVKYMTETGIDLDALVKTHNLRPNIYDNVMQISNTYELEVYEKWCSEKGKEPLPYWRDEPDKDDIPVRNDEFYAEVHRRRDAWLIESGYELNDFQ